MANKNVAKKCAIGTLFLSLLLNPTAVFAEWTEWIKDLKIGYEDHDNLNRSAFSSDDESDSIILVSGSFGRAYQISSTSRLTVTADAKWENYNDFDELNGGHWGVSGNINKKFGTGPEKPWLTVYVQYEDWNRDDSFWATENVFTGVQLGKSFSPRWSAWVGAESQNRSGEDGTPTGELSSDVFSESLTQLSAQTNFSLTESWLLSLRLDIWSGEFHSACTGPNVAIALDREGDNIRAVAKDPKVFGGCVYSIDDGDGESIALSLSYSINRHSSLDFRYQENDAEGDELDYDNSFLSAAYSYRF